MLSVQQLRVVCRAQTTVRFNEHKGSAIRGALYTAIRGPEQPRAGWSGFCANKAAPHCSECPVSAVCPVMRLVLTLDEQGAHGRDAPRPYIINPPLDGRQVYAAGDEFEFGISLVGQAADLFPYVVLGLDRLEHEGIGQRTDDDQGRYRRGTAKVVRMDAVHPFGREPVSVLREGERQVQVPALPVTHADVLAQAEALPEAGPLTLEFLTPMRLVDRQRLVQVPIFRPLIQRLLERIKSLVSHFGEGEVPFDIAELRDRAESVRLAANGTRWQEVRGYSARLRRGQELGGMVGRVRYECDDWRPFRPWLVWGTLLHAGKNAVKGDGWYRLVGERP